AEEDLVEVKLENLVLAEGLLDALGEQRLLQLALSGLFAGEQKILGHLLGDRGGADEFSRSAEQAILQVDENRAPDALPVEAGMAVEILVLSRQKGLDDARRHGIDRNEQTPFLGVFGEE